MKKAHMSMIEIHMRVETESRSSGLKEFLKERVMIPSLSWATGDRKEEEREKQKTPLSVSLCDFAFIHYLLIR